MSELSFFSVPASKYDSKANFCVVRPASIVTPKDNAVMFLTASRVAEVEAFNNVRECLIFWPEEIEVPQKIAEHNAVYACKDPHLEYCRFFQDNDITDIPKVVEEVVFKDGYYIAKTAIVGKNTLILPGAYIGGEVVIGDNCYIGSGVKILGRVAVGNDVVIRENSVIGGISMSTDRTQDGLPIAMPQLGGIQIKDNVQIGANALVSRGAIDDTVLCRGCKIDSMVFIAHNVTVGEYTIIVGNSFLLGSASVGKRTLISGNCSVQNYVHIGDDCIIGTQSMVRNDIPNGSVAYGSPAKVMRKNEVKW